MPSFASSAQSAKIGLSKWIFYVKKLSNISEFLFSLKNMSLGTHFLLKWFFGNFNFKTFLLLKSDPIFDELAKLGKATHDAYNQGGWLIL